MIAAMALSIALSMDEAAVAAAIADTKATTCYELKPGKWELRQPITFGCMTTPYSRVAALAQAARRAYKPFTPADVPAEVIEPYFEVIAFAEPGKSVEAVVLAKKGSKGVDSVVQPITSAPTTSEFQNLYGAKFEGAGMLARFNLSDYQEGWEIRAVRSGREFRAPMQPGKFK